MKTPVPSVTHIPTQHAKTIAPSQLANDHDHQSAPRLLAEVTSLLSRLSRQAGSQSMERYFAFVLEIKETVQDNDNKLARDLTTRERRQSKVRWGVFSCWCGDDHAHASTRTSVHPKIHPNKSPLLSSPQPNGSPTAFIPPTSHPSFLWVLESIWERRACEVHAHECWDRQVGWFARWFRCGLRKERQWVQCWIRLPRRCESMGNKACHMSTGSADACLSCVPHRTAALSCVKEFLHNVADHTSHNRYSLSEVHAKVICESTVIIVLPPLLGGCACWGAWCDIVTTHDVSSRFHPRAKIVAGFGVYSPSKHLLNEMLSLTLPSSSLHKLPKPWQRRIHVHLSIV